MDGVLTTLLTTTAARIERIIRRRPGSATAEFWRHFRDGESLFCVAHIDKIEPRQEVMVARKTLSVEESGVMVIALQMAIEWIAEEVARQ